VSRAPAGPVPPPNLLHAGLSPPSMLSPCRLCLRCCRPYRLLRYLRHAPRAAAPVSGSQTGRRARKVAMVDCGQLAATPAAAAAGRRDTVIDGTATGIEHRRHGDSIEGGERPAWSRLAAAPVLPGAARCCGRRRGAAGRGAVLPGRGAGCCGPRRGGAVLRGREQRRGPAGPGAGPDLLTAWRAIPTRCSAPLAGAGGGHPRRAPPTSRPTRYPASAPRGHGRMRNPGGDLAGYGEIFLLM